MNSAELKEAYRYCEGVTREHAKSFYFANKFLPKNKQKAVYALYALCRHIDDEVDEAGVDSELAAKSAIEQWRQRLNAVYAGNFDRAKTAISSGDDEAGLVFVAWEDLLTNHKIQQQIPLDLMKGVLMDTHKKRYESFEELYVYCYRVASTVGLMSSEILGYSDESALEYAEALGIAMQLTNILRDVREDAAMGRIYLPKEDLERFGVTEEQIFGSVFSNDFRELVKFQIERAKKYYLLGEKGIPLLAKDSRFCVLLASRIYAQILDELEKQDYNLFAGRVFTSSSQKLLSVPRIWREARRL